MAQPRVFFLAEQVLLQIYGSF